MPSTPRTESPLKQRLVGLSMVLVVAGLVFGGYSYWPAMPTAPRWLGAGDDTPRDGGTFIFHHESNVRSLDPHIAYDELSGMAVRLIYDGLLDYDYDSNLIPRIAEALPTITDEGKTFHFRLRHGVRFHPLPGHPDGRELTALDVRFSMERLLSHTTGSPGFPFYKSIEGAEEYHEGHSDHVSGIRVLDRYTIEFHLTEPDQTFLNAMAMTFAYPVAHETYEHWGAEANMHPAGTGPFVFDSWERGVDLRFSRNSHYFLPHHPGPDHMVFQENLQRAVAFMRFLNGDLDAIHRETTPDYLLLKGAPAWAPYRLEFPHAQVFGIGMNCEIAPFDDVHIRRAIAFALDREGWARARAGRLQPAGQAMPPMIPGFDANLPNLQTFDLTRAREQMRLAGHPDGLDDEIEVWFTEGETSRFYGELLQQDLARIGIRVRIRQVSFATYLEQTGKPHTVAAFSTGWNMDFPDPSNFLDILFNSRSIHPDHSENRSFYRNPEVDRLLDTARSETDHTRRIALYRQANDIVSQDAPWAFAYYPMSFEAWQPYVKNYRPHPIWSEDYRDVWLDLPRRHAERSLFGTGHARNVAATLFPFGGLR